MSLTATDFTPARQRHCSAGRGAASGPGQDGPVIDEVAWGFVVRPRQACGGRRARIDTLTRFLGTFSMVSIAAMLVTPEYGVHTLAFGLKLALIFAVALGVAVVSQAGVAARNREFHIDTRAGEIRVGQLRRKGRFALAARLPFTQVHSVYLYRTKDRSRPARLFVRLDEGGTALEVARGPEHALDALRARLAQTLAPSSRPAI